MRISNLSVLQQVLRGNCGGNSWLPRWENWTHAFLMPFLTVTNDHMVVEDVHLAIFPRGILSFLLWPFFLVGLITSIFSMGNMKGFSRMCAWVWIISNAIFAKCGPNVKYFYSQLPFSFFLVVQGLNIFNCFLQKSKLLKKIHDNKMTITIIFLIVYSVFELTYVFDTYPKKPYHGGRNIVAEREAVAALDVAKAKQGENVLICPFGGLDTVNYYIRRIPSIKVVLPLIVDSDRDKFFKEQVLPYRPITIVTGETGIAQWLEQKIQEGHSGISIIRIDNASWEGKSVIQKCRDRPFQDSN